MNASQASRSRDYITLLDILEQAAISSEESPCFVTQEAGDFNTRQVLSYRTARQCLQAHKEWLHSKMKLVLLEPNNCFRKNKADKENDIVIAYLSHNSMDMFLSILAATSSRNKPGDQLPALLNARWTAHEMVQALQSRSLNGSAKSLLLYGEGYENIANNVIRQLDHHAHCLPIPTLSTEYYVPLATLGQSPVKLNDKWNYSIRDIQERGDCKDAFILFASGTTGGGPRGVRLSHRAVAIQALAKLEYPCQYSRDTTMIASTVPLFHIGGLSSCLAVLFAGGCLIFPNKTSDRAFSPAVMEQSITSPILPANTLVVVPVMLVSLLSILDASSVYPNVQLILIGGQSASESLVEKLKVTFPNARIVQTFACTEAASSLTFWYVNRLDNTKKKSASMKQQQISAIAVSATGNCVGTPPNHVQLQLHRTVDGTKQVILEPFQMGIIATRGPHVMNGYWERGNISPSEQSPIDWFETNDLGYWDHDGQLHFCGRVRDVIRSGGETVLAQEVERVLLQHDAVEDCAVFGQADEMYGEAVACALVVNQNCAKIELNTIKAWCQEQGLASYKRPRYMYIVPALPRNSSGKVLKHKLISQFGKKTSKL